MDFLLSDIHDDLASSIDALLTKADMPTVIRSWIAGDRGPAQTIFGQLAEIGVFGLLIDDDHGGAGAGAVEMVVALDQLGYHGVPGPLAETIAVAPALLGAAGLPSAVHEHVAAGALVSVAAPPVAPLAADVA
ncbi:MAG: acyl-CoA dehydrogenase family protein, partial [Gordonia sp. (in: high G+C Gram-positive bacteria)]